MRLALFLIGAAGCDGVLGLTAVPPPPIDAAIDAPAACVNLQPFGANCRTIMPPLIADTALVSTSPDVVYGAKDAVRVNGTDPALFKFDISEVAPTERIARATLFVPFVANNASATACSTSSSMCAICGVSSYESSTLYWTTTDWTQLFATYNTADQGRAWMTPGAAGMERSELVATGPASNGSMVVDILEADMLRVQPDCFRSTTQLSMLVLVDGGLAWLRQLGNQPCVTEKSATLELTVCQ